MSEKYQWSVALRPRIFAARLVEGCSLGHAGALVWVAQYGALFAIAHTPVFALQDFERVMTMPAKMWQEQYGYVVFEELKGAVDEVR